MPRRKPNGEGSISRRKDGRYEAAFSVTTISGKRKRVRLYGRTRAEAHEKLIETKAKVQQGTPLADKTWKLGDYLNYWLEEVVKANKRPATYAQCEQTVRLYLTPGLGKLSLAKLSVPIVQQFLNQMLSAGHSIPKAQVVRKVLSAALSCAMREELISRNVARLTILPTYEPDDVEPWAAEEAKHFLAVSQSDPLYPAFVLLFIYGLRRGEVLGLRWCDIDFEHNVIHVRQQLQRVGHSLQLGLLKTKAGRRDLALLYPVDRILLEHQRRQVREKQAAGNAWLESGDDEGLVFTAEHGKPMEASTLVRAFHRVCRVHGIRRVRIHDARDGLGTLLDVLGVPVKQAQIILGHSRATTTLQYYQHGQAEKQRASLEQVGAVLLPAKQKDDSTVQYYRRVGDCCRHFCRQASLFIDTITTSISGAGEGTLTPGLILGKSINASVSDRATEVNRELNDRRRQWLIGIVAVNIAVRSCPSPKTKN